MEITNEKPKHTRPTPTEIEYLEKAQWKVGEDIITVRGGLPNEEKQPIATIRLNGYDGNKKPILSVHDLDGQEITERSSNLYDLKKQVRDAEERLTKQMLIKRDGVPAPEPEQKQEGIVLTPAPEEKEGERKHVRRKNNTKDNSHEVSR